MVARPWKILWIRCVLKKQSIVDDSQNQMSTLFNFKGQFSHIMINVVLLRM